MTSRLGMTGAGSGGRRAADRHRAGAIAWQSATKSATGIVADVPITITRTNGLLAGAKCDVVSADGTATAGVNYTAVNTDVTFAAGQTTVSITLHTLAGALVAPVTLTITLQEPSGGATIGSPAVCTVTLNPPA